MAHVLIVEDEKELGDVIERALATWGHTNDWAQDGRRALDLVFAAEREYDLVLCDLHMPGTSGGAFLLEAQDLLHFRTPVVVMSGFDYMVEALGELRRGAFTLLQKPFDMAVLRETVERGLDQRSLYVKLRAMESRLGELTRRNDMLRQQNADLFEQARLDPLTSLPNRRRLTEDLDIVDANARRYKSHFALALLDIDLFKRFNTEYGVEQGDAALLKVAATIREACRQGDMLYRPNDLGERSVYRFGGDEFVLVLAAQDTPRAVLAMERVRRRLVEAQADTPPGGEVVTVSIGVAANDPAKPKTVEELLRDANGHLIAAKKAGGDCVRPALTSE
jgi:diguanylate cyclase (GGDEF)-like protein